MKPILADPAALKVEKILSKTDAITLVVRTSPAHALCPRCQKSSNKVHSRYLRTIADLPWQGVAVKLRLHTRKFFCLNQQCLQRIFCERLPKVVARYSRRTLRLNEALAIIGFALGGRAGARAARKLSMHSSRHTLLRRIRQSTLVQNPTPRVLGVDDWAFRRGQRYGTLLVDLEQRCPIDLLPDRDAETLACWLRANAGVEIISRDRSTSYADGPRAGAPSAIQVADRWHLLKNLGEAVERFLGNRHEFLRQAAAIITQSQLSSSSPVIEAEPVTMLSSRNSQQIERNRQKRHARYCEVLKLHREGVSMPGIAQMLKMGRRTVRKQIESNGFADHAPRPKRGSQLEKHTAYLHRRRAGGCDNALQLWREIAEQGYSGKAAMVRRYIMRLRKRMAGLTPDERERLLRSDTSFKTPSAKRARWWLIGKAEDLTAEQQLFIQQLCRLCPDAGQAQDLVQDSQKIVNGREAERLDGLLDAAEQSGVVELQGFATGLRKDRDCVEAALKHHWSNGQVEGQVNRLKMIKRQMYGRANFDLLRARVLHRA
jgi:transposase